MFARILLKMQSSPHVPLVLYLIFVLAIYLTKKRKKRNTGERERKIILLKDKWKEEKTAEDNFKQKKPQNPP